MALKIDFEKNGRFPMIFFFMYQQNRTCDFLRENEEKRYGHHKKFSWWPNRVDFIRTLPTQQFHLALALQPFNLRPGIRHREMLPADYQSHAPTSTRPERKDK